MGGGLLGGGATGGGAAVVESVAGDEVVVGDAGGLHEGVDDGGAHAAEAPADHVLAHGLRLRGLHRDLPRVAESADDGLLVHEAPAVAAERPELLPNLPQPIQNKKITIKKQGKMSAPTPQKSTHPPHKWQRTHSMDAPTRSSIDFVYDLSIQHELGTRKNREDIRRPTLSIWRAFSMVARSLASESSALAGLPGAVIFFSLILETATGSKPAKRSLKGRGGQFRRTYKI